MGKYQLISFREFLVSISVSFLFFLFTLFYFKGLWHNPILRGWRAFHKQNYTLAQKHFEQALSKNPLDPLPYINLAIVEDVLGRPDKALKIYDIVLSRLSDPPSAFISYLTYYNIGELNGRLGRRDQALKNYQKALEPDFRAILIKQNIELLFQETDSQQQAHQNQDPKKNQNPQRKSEGQKEDSSHSEQQPISKNPLEKDLRKNDSPSKGEKTRENSIGNIEEKAILEEVEKQENKVRSKFYKRNRPFGDKTQKDW